MRLGRYTFMCVFESEAVLPAYKGSTFRGVFGHAFKGVVCALKHRDCAECLLSGRCLYPQVFEPVPDPRPGVSRKRIAVPPHPYVIQPPADSKTVYNAQDPFEFSLMLFGEFNKSLPYFVYAIEQMGSAGIGRRVNGKAGSYRLAGVTARGHEVYSGAHRALVKGDFDREVNPQELVNLRDHDRARDTIGIRLLTPLRLKHQNRLVPELPFHVLVRAALRRASALFERFDGAEPALDYRGMVRRAERVRTAASAVRWHDWRRYSTRQEAAMLMGGMTGEVVYEGELGEFMPLLRFCEQVHLGKQTTFGLGRIALFDPGGGAA